MYTQFEAAEFLHRAYNLTSYEDQFKAIEKLANEFETPGNRAWTQIVGDIIAWIQQGLRMKEINAWNLLGGPSYGYDTNKLAKQLTMIRNWVLEFHKGEVDVSPIKYTLKAFGKDFSDFNDDVEFVVNDEYDENREPIGEAAYHKNKEEKEEKEWLSRIQENTSSEDSILRAIFDKAAGDKNKGGGGAMRHRTIQKGEMDAYLIEKCNVRSNKEAIRTLNKISMAMFRNADPRPIGSLTESQFLNIMRGARGVIEDNKPKGSDSRNRPTKTPYWCDFYEAFVMDKVQSKEILETFKAHDRDKSGLIELSELREDYDNNKQIGGEVIKSMDKYDTDNDRKLNLKEFRYWHWDTNTLDQPSPEEIQERDRLVALIKNLKDAFSTFTNDIEHELEDYPLAPAESKFMSAEPLIHDGHGSYELKEGDIGSTQYNAFQTKKAGCDVLFPYVEKCLTVIDKYNSVPGNDKIEKVGIEFGHFWAGRRTKKRRAKKYDIYINGKGNTVAYLRRDRHRNKQSATDFLFNSSPPFDDSTIVKPPPTIVTPPPTIVTPPQSPKRMDSRDVIIEDAPVRRNTKNLFKILMEKFKQPDMAVTEIESLNAEYIRLRVIAKKFIQGAEKDLEDLPLEDLAQ